MFFWRFAGKAELIYRFEGFSLDTDRYELTRDGAPVPIEPQVLALLGLLITRRDRMVTKDEIIEAVWDGRFVSDAALSSRVKSARQALGDDGRAQRFIKTVHKKGFRFVGDVQEGQAGIASIPAPSKKKSDRPAVAILPFTSLSDDPDQQYFTSAIAQDIANALSRHRWLDIVGHNELRPYVDAPDVMAKLRAHLNVDYVVEGSARRANNRIRVTAHLVSAADGRTQWAETYNRDLEDVFQVQDEIATTIVARLEPEIGAVERQRVAQTPHPDLQAWDCYHLGIAHFFKFTAEDNLEAQRLLSQSRQLDPGFGEAHAWWAYAVVLGMVYWDVEVSSDLLDDALKAAKTALSLDDRNAVFYALMARVQLARREYSSALVENEMAISLNPALASAHCGLADSLSYEGRYDEAIERFEYVIELSTNDPQRWAFYTYGALTMIFAGDYERAVRWCDSALGIPNRQYWTQAHKMVALAYLGRDKEAAQTKAQLLIEKPSFNLEFAKSRLFYLKRDEQLKCYTDGLAKAGF